MKLPERPIPHDEFLKGAVKNPSLLMKIFTSAQSPTTNGHYSHWDKYRYHKPLEGLSIEESWQALKSRRRALYQHLPFLDKTGIPFVYLIADPSPETLHRIDLGCGGLIQMPDQITNPATRDQYYVGSLIEEAITSSQLEGASTTRLVAKEMIRTGRKPRDKSERMILNNYLAMKEIGTLKDKKLTKELVFRIHRIVTDETLDDPSAAGRFRRSDEKIAVMDEYGTMFHDPPPATELDDRMEKMCKFANAEIPDGFMYPTIRSIILHFWLAYDHPFVDGNGRTARALFYWSMLRHNYWLFEFVSISKIIRKAPTQYGRAFLYTENDDNDLTYFIRYHLRVIENAIKELHAFIKHKTRQLQRLEEELRGLQVLNHRQRDLIGHAIRHPRQRYTVESHKISHNVVYETARSDLLDLRDRGLLSATKVGKEWHFSPIKDLESHLAKLSSS